MKIDLLNSLNFCTWKRDNSRDNSAETECGRKYVSIREITADTYHTKIFCPICLKCGRIIKFEGRVLILEDPWKNRDWNLVYNGIRK